MSEISRKAQARLLGEVLRTQRGERSQASVASAAGMPHTQLSGYETGRNLPRPENLARLARALSSTPEHLWAEVDRLAVREAGLREETVKGFWAVIEPWLRKLVREELEAARVRWLTSLTPVVGADEESR
jgi:transcriptional regulator with XRE-family HTH domain